MATKLILGVDIGTGSTKGVLVAPDGEVVAVAETPHDLSLPQPGWAEHGAEDVWWADFTKVCQELAPKADGGIAGVAVSGIGPCILVADADGRPLRPAILYGIDTRSGAEVDEINERYGVPKITKRCGNPLNAQSIGARILWLRRHEPEVYEQARHFFMAHTFIAHRLTGAYYLDHICASYSEPLYDVSKGRWAKKWVRELAPGLPMPELKWPSEVVGHVTAAAAERTGLPEGLPVIAGTMDAFADAMSVGVRRPGDGVMIYGSTMTIMRVTSEFLPSAELWSNAHLFRGTHNLAAGTNTSGSLTKWLRDLAAKDTDFAALVDEAATVRPGSDGLVALPYFAGERTPLLDPDARGTICGLTLHHGRGHLYRALMEGVAYGSRHILEVMHQAGSGGDTTYAVGGGTKGNLWPQIVSDVTGMTQHITEQSMGACYGDAMLAGLGAGLLDEETNWTKIVDTVKPNPAHRELYDSMYGLYRKLHLSTVDVQHSLAYLQRQSGLTDAAT